MKDCAFSMVASTTATRTTIFIIMECAILVDLTMKFDDLELAREVQGLISLILLHTVHNDIFIGSDQLMDLGS